MGNPSGHFDEDLADGAASGSATPSEVVGLGSCYLVLGVAVALNVLPGPGTTRLSAGVAAPHVFNGGTVNVPLNFSGAAAEVSRLEQPGILAESGGPIDFRFKREIGDRQAGRPAQRRGNISRRGDRARWSGHRQASFPEGRKDPKGIAGLIPNCARLE